ncbi:MAG: hypothetical protein BWX93_01705 [Bacteroidetes bacterium ADurb.Bin139]|nr:MAG: hypothetical protein BWX93_01705 [Bacteroidetes bacterium ADurb.Bin139]
MIQQLPPPEACMGTVFLRAYVRIELLRDALPVKACKSSGRPVGIIFTRPPAVIDKMVVFFWGVETDPEAEHRGHVDGFFCRCQGFQLLCYLQPAPGCRPVGHGQYCFELWQFICSTYYIFIDFKSLEFHLRITPGNIFQLQRCAKIVVCGGTPEIGGDS